MFRWVSIKSRRTESKNNKDEMGCSTSSTQSAYQVMVWRLRIAIACKDQWPLTTGLTIPPILCHNIGASGLWDAFVHQWTERLQQAKTRLVQSAKVAVEIHETDNASANDKLFAHFCTLIGHLPATNSGALNASGFSVWRAQVLHCWWLRPWQSTRFGCGVISIP